MLIKNYTWITLLASFLFFFGCDNKKHENSHVTMQTDNLNISFMSEATSIDPRFGYEPPANFIAKMLFDGLMRFSAEGSLVTAVAEKVEISADRKTYIFQLRPCLWSNGAEVTAFDFEYAWKSVIDPELDTKGASDFFVIKNVQAITRKQVPLDTVGIHAMGPRILKVELEYPAPYFLELTATAAYSPVYKEGTLKNPQWAMQAGPDFVCNGPFILKEWKKQYQYLFEKNPLYWDADNVHLSSITASIIEDPQTALLLFQTGKLDWYGKPFSKISLDAVPYLKEKEILELKPELAIYWYFINVDKYPFTNKKIRQAFSLAVNRKAITSHLLQEGERPAFGIVPSFAETAFKMDDEEAIEKAKILFEHGLNELGITRNEFPEIPLDFCGIEVNKQIAQAIQQQWQQHLHVKVKLVPQEWTIHYDNLSVGNFTIGGMSWHSRISDPIYNLEVFKFRNSGLNMSKWESNEFQQLLDRSNHAINQEQRETLLHQAEALLMEEMPVIPIYFLSLGYAKNPHLHDVLLSELNQIDFKSAYKDNKVNE